MKNQIFDDLTRKEEIRQRDHEDYDQYSSSESCSNVAISIQEKKKSNRASGTDSSKAKRKTKVSSSVRSRFVIAEENRSEKNMQRKFQELSSVVPGSNMKDDDLMLDDAISYLKRLQERVNTLDEKNKYIYVEKVWGFGDNNFCQSTSSSVYQFKQDLPEIEAKAQGKDVLIRVHCENKKGYQTKVLGEIEKLHLNVENISTLPFGDYFLDITINAQMDDEFCMTVKDIKMKLRAALQLIM